MATTATFPGAAVNTEPITTMATSLAQPETSHSSASVVPLTAPSGSVPPASASSLPAPSSVDPGFLLPEEGRSGSAASNPKDITEPESVDPLASTATTSADGTTSTSTTTTTSTTGANTTTTNCTGTIVTGRISPAIPTQSLFNETIARCNNCLFLIRKLRYKQNEVSDIFLNYDDDESYKDFDTLMKEVMGMFEKLDYYARRLPKVVPPIDNINIMRTLYSQEHTMNHTNISNLVERMIDSGNWNEGNYQVFYFLSELLRMNAQRRKFIYVDRKPYLEKPKFISQATTGHGVFETAYKAAKKDIVNKSLGIYPRTLLKTNTSLTIEFQFGCGGTKIVNDSEVIYTMKFLLVERFGIVEFINMYATHESWDTHNDFGKRTLNPYTLSRYEVYRSLTRQANRHLLNCFGTNTSRWTAHTLIQFVSLFGKFREVFTTRCRSCKKILKNCLPPMNFDIRSPMIAYHETCR